MHIMGYDMFFSPVLGKEGLEGIPSLPFLATLLLPLPLLFLPLPPLKLLLIFLRTH